MTGNGFQMIEVQGIGHGGIKDLDLSDFRLTVTEGHREFISYKVKDECF